jgi:hypothetical protein
LHRICAEIIMWLNSCKIRIFLLFFHMVNEVSGSHNSWGNKDRSLNFDSRFYDDYGKCCAKYNDICRNYSLVGIGVSYFAVTLIILFGKNFPNSWHYSVHNFMRGNWNDMQHECLYYGY